MTERPGDAGDGLGTTFASGAPGPDADPGRPGSATERRSVLRAWLLSTGYLTYDTLARLLGGTTDAARAFVTRERDANRVFTVKHDARTLIPAVLFDADGRVTPIARAVEVLRPVGVDGWALWGWLATPSSWLSGDVPAEVLVTDLDRGLAAARAYTSSLEDTGAPRQR